MDPATIIAAILSGLVIGAILGLVGGGGSILAVPLLVHFVGLDSAHQAIGTAALAVAANAGWGLTGHVRAGNVKWGCGIVFALAGVVGAAMGAETGKAVDGQQLLTLFGLLMIGVGLLMLRKRRSVPNHEIKLTKESAKQLLPKLISTGFAVGIASGFFGIGGGFLIVPGLILATGMPITYAIGTSLASVTAFGLTTATSYAISGLVNWPLAALVIAGGAAGSWLGVRAGVSLAERKRVLEIGFAILVMAVGAYVAAKASIVV